MALTEFQVWPQGQKVERWFDTPVFVTHFADVQSLNQELLAVVLEREADPAFANPSPGRAIGSVKLYDVDRWGCPASDLLHQRALALFKGALQKKEVSIDLSWATLYRDGDYCMPHSHPRTLASVLYMLDPGDSVDPNDGRFCFADPRLKVCCREEDGFMSTPSAPEMPAGTMLLFPGQLVHFVHTYRGKRPRITLSWNLNERPRPGEALPYQVKR